MDMDPQGLREHMGSLLRDNGIVDFGVADAASWETDPLVSARIEVGCRPKDIMPGARSVIVFGIPIQNTILETAPSIYYNHLYGVVNNMLDQLAERVVLELLALGHHAVYVPRDGYHGIVGLKQRPDSFFSHRHSAYLAGLGNFGYNNMLLTPRNGPRIRFTSVITDAQLPADSPITERICIGCRKCTRVCPVSAVPDHHYPEGLVDKTLCVGNSERLAREGISPCGRCIAVCPIGNDRIAGPTEDAVSRIREYRKPI
ncbi:MAG: 4Fe-4S dicluster domain-containing protein [Candidatus Methanomethylophilaceae archaeon]